ncbi:MULTISPECIES: hypothetical protein [unclassified Streptomyces]|uniref:hypothetical protein n=1 Tax=unclassified Streptomyces TaxID=2593676 RepID=UPI0005A769A3|nr:MULTISPECIES: hypothetical protein [unclassified Streptomyces]ODA70489.1 hypothetical protein APS67_005358 [Streptomyces sp. AVP053U2]
MTRRWIGLILFSLTLLPAGPAVVTGHVPERLRLRLAPTPPRGWAVLALYAAAPLNAIPRLAGASPAITPAATAAAGVVAAGGCAVAAIALHRAAGPAS